MTAYSHFGACCSRFMLSAYAVEAKTSGKHILNRENTLFRSRKFAIRNRNAITNDAYLNWLSSVTESS